MLGKKQDRLKASTGGKVARIIVPTVACLLVSFGLLTSSASEAGLAQSEPERPNIILLMTDDLDVRSAQKLSGLQQMVPQQGFSFSNAYVSDPLCCPSRASVLRGQYVHNHGVKHHYNVTGGYDAFESLESSTFATWLDEAGYRTAYVGKYFNNYDTTKVPVGWDEWYGWMGNFYDPNQRQTYRINENGVETRYPTSNHHDTDILAAKSTDFVSRASEGSEPFFLYLSVNAPHDPPSVAGRHARAFSNVRLPKPPSYNEKDVSDKPRYIRKLKPLSKGSYRGQVSYYRQWLRSMLSVQDALRSLISELEAKGELDNTYIFFTSDNGFHMGEHRMLRGKRLPYQEDTKVPLYVRGPGVSRGSTASLTSNIDLAPTFADIAGADTPDFVDGRSLLPLLQGRAVEGWRQRLLVEWYVEGSAGRRIPSYRSVVKRNLTFTSYSTGERELYNLNRDPFQLNNRWRNVGKGTKSSLWRQLSTLSVCSGESCRQAESQ